MMIDFMTPDFTALIPKGIKAMYRGYKWCHNYLGSYFVLYFESLGYVLDSSDVTLDQDEGYLSYLMGKDRKMLKCYIAAIISSIKLVVTLRREAHIS